MRLFLDIDGVLADFVSAANAIHGRHGHVPDKYDYFLDWGYTAADFWKPIHDVGDAFWAKLARTPHCYDVIVECEKHFCDQVCLLSNAAYTARKEWIRRHLPQRLHDKFLLGPAKAFCAGPDCVLVDDCEANVEGFIRAGGIGILFPAPWNCLRDRINPVLYLSQELAAIAHSPARSV